MRRLTATAALVLAAAPLAAQRGDDFRWSGRLAAGQEVEIVAITGDIRAEPAGGSTLEVTGEMRGRRVPVRVVQHEGGVAFCVEYPDARVGGSNGRCPSYNNVRDPDAVNFTVRVPEGVRFIARTVQGDVEARDLRGPVRASTVSGGVDVRTSDVAEASSVSGDLRVAMGRMPRDGSLRFSSVSGDVRLTLPADAGAQLSASTVSGDIDSDFPLTLSGRGRSWPGRRIQATLGRGGPELRISTVSGDIQLERGR